MEKRWFRAPHYSFFVLTLDNGNLEVEIKKVLAISANEQKGHFILQCCFI